MKNKNPNSLFDRFLGNVFAGLFLVLPVAVIIMILLKVYGMLFAPVRAFALKLGIERPFLVQLLLIFTLVMICFVAGLMMHARAVSRFRDRLENGVLRFVPGYEYVRMKLAMMVGTEESSLDRGVLVRIDDGWSPALMIEEGDDGKCTVFVPDVPKSNSGSVYIVEPGQVKHLNVKFKELDMAIRNYGKGLGKIAREAKG
ncbi:MAG TPA: hypothetical protein VFX73_11405 [Chitinophagaceae bacterium]|nr:hypothetical protein [Chitinophagaceae bacterium]